MQFHVMLFRHAIAFAVWLCEANFNFISEFLFGIELTASMASSKIVLADRRCIAIRSLGVYSRQDYDPRGFVEPVSERPLFATAS